MNALEELVAAILSQQPSARLKAPFDPAWRSPCELDQDDSFTYWRPIKQSPPVDFAGLEHALELTLHPDIVSYYAHYWSGTLNADSKEGQVSLIQLWNPDDFDRLIANLIGHALAKHRQKQSFTVFFANTEPDSECFLSIDNDTGRILLEEPGKPPIREVETDIHAFLERLTPADRPVELY